MFWENTAENTGMIWLTMLDIDRTTLPEPGKLYSHSGEDMVYWSCHTIE